MPASKYYVVTEEREIKIRASSPAEAVSIADNQFRNGKTDSAIPAGDELEGALTSIEQVSISARESF